MDRDVQKEARDAGIRAAREFLSQAYHLDQRISSKIEQVESLNDLARKAGCAISGMPRNPDRAVSPMADAVERIVDLQAEINGDIRRMVELKARIMAAIREVEDPELQTLLEQRYLNFHTWGQIAEDMGYNARHLYRLHDRALLEIKIPEVVTGCQ
ncbi:MAG: hypothetical protein NC131_18355 [Roseburia sp.]|nr:hypothetical protein [Roseburia sp.]